MKIQDLDLEKYYQDLLLFGGTIEGKYLIKKREFYEELIKDMSLFSDNLTNKIVLESKNLKLDKVKIEFMEIERLRNNEIDKEQTEWSNERKLLLAYSLAGGEHDYKEDSFFSFLDFIPTNEQSKGIEKFRRIGYDLGIENFRKRLGEESKNIQNFLDNLQYNFTDFYRLGKPIRVELCEENKDFILKFARDLGKYDLVKYLKNRLLELEKPSIKKEKNNSRERLDKKERHLEYVKYFNRQIKDFKKSRKDAFEKTMKEYNVSKDTVNRALKNEK